MTRRPSLRSESSCGPCGPAWTGASRPSTTSRRTRDEQAARGLLTCGSGGAAEAANAGVSWLGRHFELGPTPPTPVSGDSQIRAYQVYLATERGLATSSLTVAVAALRFLYRVTLGKQWSFDDVIPAPKKPKSLPVVLSPQGVAQFLDTVKPANHRTILTACYAAGLRISEAIHFTVSAIDSDRMVLRIVKGKGQKDRYVMLSPKLLAVLRTWWKV